MLTTLREISVRVPSSELEQSSSPTEQDSAFADRATPTPFASGEDLSGVDVPNEVGAPPKYDTISTTVSQLPKEGSENGTETEEDDMVLVGRPQ